MPRRSKHLTGLILGASIAAIVSGPVGFFAFCAVALLAWLIIGLEPSS